MGRGLPLYWSATCNLVDTLLARGHVEEAWAIAEQYGFAPPYPSTIVLPDPRSVRGRLLLAVGRTKDGINELEAAEKAAAVRGHHNPVLVPWAFDLARALAVEDPVRAAQLATDVRRHAERLGTDTAIGEALRCAAALETGQRAVRLAAQAVTYLEASPCQYEHAAARVEYGILARSVGRAQPGPGAGAVLRGGRAGGAGAGRCWRRGGGCVTRRESGPRRSRPVSRLGGPSYVGRGQAVGPPVLLYVPVVRRLVRPRRTRPVEEAARAQVLGGQRQDARGAVRDRRPGGDPALADHRRVHERGRVQDVHRDPVPANSSARAKVWAARANLARQYAAKPA